MKRVICTFLTTLLCIVLCACTSTNDIMEPTIIGTWEGSGTVSIIGENAPMKTIEHWTFTEDGTAAMVITTPNMTLPAAEFTYTLENGVLTFTANGRSEEFSCELTADTMTLGDSLVFTRVE